jgi:conjugal transfer pilus assembly protein TraI
MADAVAVPGQFPAQHVQGEPNAEDRLVLQAAHESQLLLHRDLAQSILDQLLPGRGKAVDIPAVEADRKSVERDLKANHIPVDSSLGVPVEKYLLDAMRRLIGGGRWTANTRGARVWRFADGLHVVWKAGAQEVSELLAKDRIPGIPRDPDILADILIERGLAVPRKTTDGRSFRYWRMAPAELDMAFYRLRLATPEPIYSGEPPVVVEGRVLDETGRETVLSDREQRTTPRDRAPPTYHVSQHRRSMLLSRRLFQMQPRN